MSDYHVRYLVRANSGSDTAARVIQQDDYDHAEAIVKAIRQMRKDDVLPSCDSHRHLTITVERVQ